MDILARTFRITYRLLLFLFYVIIYLTKGFRIHWFIQDPVLRKKEFSALANWITRLCCRTFSLRVSVINPPPADSPGLVIGNHLGFIDILASGSIRPMLYVTSIEMRNTPFLGLLTEMGGCIYVDRRSRMGIQAELQQIIDSLRQGFKVCLYPEATSHNGEVVLPFKRTLLSSAGFADVPIYPYVFNFKSIEGHDFNLRNRDSVCWYGDLPFITCMIRAFSLKYVDVEIKFLQPMKPTPDMERAYVADTLHAMISKEFKPVRMNDNSILEAQSEGHAHG